MEIEVCTVSGYDEVGKNMTAIRVDDEVILCDMGLFLPPIIELQDERQKTYSAAQMIQMGAIPDDSVIQDWRKKVKAIALGHAHLDHVGAVQYLASKYRVPIFGSPFTLEVTKTLLEDEKIKLPNEIKTAEMNKKIKITENISLEFINITHSTPQATLIAIHTKKGVVLYATDFKLDNSPVLGPKPNYKRLKQLKGKILICMCECLYAKDCIKMPSESVVREMLKDVLLGVDNRGKAIFVSTFGSHIPRLKSLIDFGKKLNRKVVILGRSMNKYIKAAEKVGIVNFTKEVDLLTYRKQVEKKLKQIERNRDKYMVICTGSQGEPGSILDRILNNDLHFQFQPEDNVIFSTKTIPTETNIANRAEMEKKLRQKKVRIFKDIHVSGHCGREDLRDFINLIKPTHLIPCHGEKFMEGEFNTLAVEMGYKSGKTVHIMSDGQKHLFKF